MSTAPTDTWISPMGGITFVERDETGRIVPVPPTPEQVGEQYERARAEAEALERARLADEENRLKTREQRLRERTARLLEEAAHLTNPDRIRLMGDDNPHAKWVDTRIPQQEGRVRRWRESIETAGKLRLAAWQLPDVQNPIARAALRQFVAQIAPNAIKLNCVITGETRTGKTSSAIAAGHAAIARGLSVMFVTHKSYIEAMMPSSKIDTEEYRDRIWGVDLLIIDDFGAGLPLNQEGRVSEFVNGATFALLGHRIESGRATIYTTNWTKAQIAAMFEDRIVPRMTEDAIAVSLTGAPIKDQIDF